MNFFDKYFVFSHSEKKGILLFLIIIFILSFIYWLIPRYFVPEPTDYSEAVLKLTTQEKSEEQPINQLFRFNPNTISKDSLMLLGFSSKQAWNLVNFRKKVKPFESKSELKKLYAMTDSLYRVIQHYVAIPRNKNEVGAIQSQKRPNLPEPFSFNPNTISEDSLRLLGLSEKLVKTWINYREKVGDFTTKYEVKKVYGLSDQEFQRLSNFIELELKIESTQKEEIISTIDLNTASKEELMTAKGIGNVFSDRIIEHRERIGGFVSIDQLNEVYLIDEEWLVQYRHQFKANSSKIVKLNLNTIGFKELLKHPYFSYSQTRLIINFREQHGKFTSIEQIKEFNLIKPKHYRKIAPYLTIE